MLVSGDVCVFWGFPRALGRGVGLCGVSAAFGGPSAPPIPKPNQNAPNKDSKRLARSKGRIRPKSSTTAKRSYQAPKLR